MNPELLDVVREEVPAMLERELPRATRRNPGVCILAARVGHDVLRYFGVSSEPVALRAVAGNAIWREWYLANAPEPPTPPMPDAAWSVAVGWGTQNPDPGYDGHLALRLDEGWLLDLDAGQFSRPQHSIFIPETVLAPFDQYGGIELDEGGLLSYGRIENPPNWKVTPDWRKGGNLAGPVIRAVRSRLLINSPQ